MPADLQSRLRRLGAARPTRALRPAPPPRRSDRATSLEALLPGGRLEVRDEGACFVVDKVYPMSYRHGCETLDSLTAFAPEAASPFCAPSHRGDCRFTDFVFLDTETTGLAGAGTLAFMVGVGFFDGDAFVARQYFLRDHGDELAMLGSVEALLADKAGLVTFNGRSFDVPLLAGRYLINRFATDLPDRPHIDLLPPSRRLWRQRLDSCALSSLERQLLAVRRTAEDVPGWLIPSLYNSYLMTGDPGELLRVFYHNQMDILSMVILAARIMRQFTSPQADDHPVDLLSLGRWLADMGQVEAAEGTLRLLLAATPPRPVYLEALGELSFLLKRVERREESVALWEEMAASGIDDVTPHTELAKHYEWHERDLAAARAWTRQALNVVAGWRPARASLVQPELEHRLARLERRLGAD